MKKKLLSIARFLVSFLIIGILIFIYRGRWGEVLHLVRSLNPWLLALSIFIFFVSLLIISFRLRILLAVQKINVSIRTAYYLNIIGQFFNIFLPSAVGGDLVKAYYTSKRSGDKLASFSSVIFDRFLGFFAVVCFGLGALIFYWDRLGHKSVRTTILVMVGIFFLIALILASRRVASRFRLLRFLVPSKSLTEKISNLYFAFHNYRHHKGALLSAVAISFLAQFLFIVIHYIVALSVGIQIPFGLFILIVPVVAIISMVPSVNGLGVREASIVYFFSSYTTGEKALAFALVIDVVLYLVSFLCGILYAVRGGNFRLKEIKNESPL